MFWPFLVFFLLVACCSAGGVLAVSWHVRREDPPPRPRAPRVVVQSVLVREPDEVGRSEERDA